VAGTAASQPWRTSPGATCHLDRRTHSNPADRPQDAEKRRPLTAFPDSFGVSCVLAARDSALRPSGSMESSLELPSEIFAENEGARSNSPFAGPSDELAVPRWTLVTMSQPSACPAITQAKRPRDPSMAGSSPYSREYVKNTASSTVRRCLAAGDITGSCSDRPGGFIEAGRGDDCRLRRDSGKTAEHPGTAIRRPWRLGGSI
jgi:hypothetical protein